MPKGSLRTVAMSRLTALSLALLAACATPTPYQPAVSQNGDGYTTQQIEGNRFRVSFRGNSLTGRQTVDTYMLYRAAEVALQNGDDYFVIVNRDVDKNTAYENYGDDLAWGWGGGWGWRRGFGPGFGTGADYSRPISSYTAIADVVTYRGPKPAANPYAYDAREVEKAIGPTVARVTAAPGAPAL